MSSEQKKVLCVGQICADFISVTETYPKEDSENRVKLQYWQKGGNAANFSVVLSNLGTPAEFFGTFPNISQMESSGIGSVSAARFCLSELDRHKVDYSHIALRNCQILPTTSIIINLNKGTRTILHYRGPIGDLVCGDFERLDFRDYSWIHFEGRQNVHVMRNVMEKIQEHNSILPESDKIRLSVELEISAWTQLELLVPLADLIIISKEYANGQGFLSGIETVEEYRKKIKPRGEIVCSWGHIGAAFVRNVVDDTAKLEPAIPPQAVLDTIGAGDTFQAALVHGKLNGLTLNESVKFACGIASKKISHYGYDCVIGMGIAGRHAGDNDSSSATLNIK